MFCFPWVRPLMKILTAKRSDAAKLVLNQPRHGACQRLRAEPYSAARESRIDTLFFEMKALTIPAAASGPPATRRLV